MRQYCNATPGTYLTTPYCKSYAGYRVCALIFHYGDVIVAFCVCYLGDGIINCLAFALRS